MTSSLPCAKYLLRFFVGERETKLLMPAQEELILHKMVSVFVILLPTPQLSLDYQHVQKPCLKHILMGNMHV